MYKRNAGKLSAKLAEEFPDMEVSINAGPEKPKSKSYECVYVNGKERVSLWSGLKLGPPRKLKWPEGYEAKVVAAAKVALKAAAKKK